MIYGEIKDIKFYKGLSKNLDKAIDFIIEGKYKNCKLGKNIIDEDRVYVNLNENIQTKEKGNIVEYHKKYADIHIILEGEEIIGCADFNKSIESQDYDCIKDFALMKGEMNTEFYMDTNKFLILFPYELHMPTLKVKEEKNIKKLVFKVEI